MSSAKKMADPSDILNSPFDIRVHTENFVNYLEVVILEDGTIEYAVPSHQEKLISLCLKKLGVTRGQLEDMVPEEYFFDLITWLCMTCGAISVGNDTYIGSPNQEQLNALRILKIKKLYKGIV